MMLTFQEMEQQMIDDADNEVLDQELKHVAFFKAYRPIIEKSLRDMGHVWEAKEYMRHFSETLDHRRKKRFWIRAIPPSLHRTKQQEYWKPGTLEITFWVGHRPQKDKIPGDKWLTLSIRLDGISHSLIVGRKRIKWFTITELETILNENWAEVRRQREAGQR